MGAISKKKIGIDARKQTSYGRFYDIPGGGEAYPSITNILGVVNKPALVHWAGKVEREACIAAAAKLFIDCPAELMLLLEDYDAASPNDEEAKDKARLALTATYTSLLTASIGKQKAAQKELEAAAAIGTEAHAACEWMFRLQMGLKVGPEPVIGERAKIAKAAAEAWAKEHGFEPIRSEQVVYSHRYRYAGTFDLLGYVDGRLTLIDLKTSKAVYDEMRLQLAAYWWALQEMGLEKAERAMVLRLPKLATDPEFEAVEVDSLETHLQAFLHAAELWRWQHAMEQEYRAKVEALKQGA